MLEPRAALKEIDHETALRELEEADATIAHLLKEIRELKRIRRPRGWAMALWIGWASFVTVLIMYCCWRVAQ